MHQLQDQNRSMKLFPCQLKKYINTEVNMHFLLQSGYFFRIISSTDESVILLPAKVCTKKFLFCNVFVLFLNRDKRLFSFYFKWFGTSLNSYSRTRIV